ncbi:MAG: hypothetical protein Tsb002_25740 [Wenzhouxiangellaceae bacterium]
MILTARDPAIIAHQLSYAEERLRTLAETAPQSLASARVFFTEEMNNQQLEDWAARHGHQLQHLDARITVGENSYRVLFRDIDQFAGSLSQRLAYFNLFHRQQLAEINRINNSRLNNKALSTEADQRLRRRQHEHAQLMNAPLHYVSVQLIGTHASLQELQSLDAATIRVVIDEKTSAYLPHILGRTEKRPLDLDLAPESRFGISRAPGPVSQPGEYHSGQHLSKTDSNTQRAASPWPCGPGVSGENNCPPDVTWVPDPRYSGADADFESVVRNFGGTQPYVEGYTYAWYNWSPAVASGVIRNTAAFKASGLPHCDPDFSISTLDARCGEGAQSNVVYVPNASYESEVIVPNWGCSLAPRTGTSFDRQFTCFTGSYYLANMPDWYADTTFFDDWLEFNASIGMLSPDFLLEGAEYYSYVYFWAWNNDNPTGRTAKLKGQIGAPQFGLIFSVDTSRTLESYIYIPLPVL